MDAIPPEALLADYPAEIRSQAEVLRTIVRDTVPEVIERVRGGWRLIGYEIPIGRRPRYFAYIAPEPVHVHLGFEYGAWMSDPDRRLEGAHLKLRKVRFMTFTPGEPIPTAACADLLREAVRVATLSRDERLALALDRDWAPDGAPERDRPNAGGYQSTKDGV
jgi:hypothetical protein